jgi:hypothetical protein
MNDNGRKILATLAAGPLTLDTLAQMTGIPRPSVAGSVSSMYAAGHVDPDQLSGRPYKWRITPKGQAEVGDRCPEPSPAMDVDMAHAVEFAKQLTSEGRSGDSGVLSRALLAAVARIEAIGVAVREAREADDDVWLGAIGQWDAQRMEALRQARKVAHDALRALGVEPRYEQPASREEGDER